MADGGARERYVLSFDPDSWDSVREQLHAGDFLADGDFVVEHENESAEGQRISRAHHVAVPRMGFAAITPKSADLSAERLREVRGVSRVRKEHVLRRPHVEHSAVDEGNGTLFRDADRLSWALHALGIVHGDEDGHGITVGVVDSGVEANHPDLEHCLDQRISLIDGFSPDEDDLGHGTHVVGVIAGSASPKDGVRYGIAPRARVRVYRVYGDEPNAPEGLVRSAVRRAVVDGCKVIVLAAGRDAGDDFDPLDEALGLYLARHDCLLFAAAGNESDRKIDKVEPTNAPANAPFIFAVGATTAGNGVWNASNGHHTDHARRVDGVAPGVGVLSAFLKGTTTHATGTSVATAVAAGIAAALWSRNPGMPASEVFREMERRTARVADAPLAAVGAGLLRLSDNVVRTLETKMKSEARETRESSVSLIQSEPSDSSPSLDRVFDGVQRVLAVNPNARMRVMVVEVGGNGGDASTAPTPAVMRATQPVAPGELGYTTKFNLQGHAVIALMAYDLLSDDKRAAFDKVMVNDPLGRKQDVAVFAQWPDRIKHPQRTDPENVRDHAQLGQQTRSSHYVNYPYERSRHLSNHLPDPIGEGDLLTALPKWIKQLQESLDPEERATALCFVLHLVGDLHQPLHCAALVDRELFPNGDEGGNLIRWGEDRPRSPNLHAVWDDSIAEKPADVAKRLAEMKEYTRADFAAELKRKKIEEWAAESYEIAKQGYDDFFEDTDYIGPSEAAKGGQQFNSPSSDYRANVRDIVRKRGALAAMRLADILAQAL